ncbi:hypothetical protein ACWCQZ_44170 [Streptomyces sp. NPDC002285]
MAAYTGAARSARRWWGLTRAQDQRRSHQETPHHDPDARLAPRRPVRTGPGQLSGPLTSPTRPHPNGAAGAVHDSSAPQAPVRAPPGDPGDAPCRRGRRNTACLDGLAPGGDLIAVTATRKTGGITGTPDLTAVEPLLLTCDAAVSPALTRVPPLPIM